MNLFQLASRGIDLDALPDESAPERVPLAFEPTPAGSKFAVPQELDAAFQAAGDEYGVDPDVLRAMAFAESRFRSDVISGQVKSRTGATGLMQFMPGTAERFGINPLDPVESIFGAAAYMRSNLEKFDGDYGKAVAAYNWGENRKAYDADDWKDRLPAETRGYLDTVFGAADELKLRAPAQPESKTKAAPNNAPQTAKEPAPIPERTWGEAFGDTTKSLAQGLLDVGSLPGVAYSAVTGDWDTGYLKAIRGTQEVLQDQKSAEIQARNKELQSKLGTAEGWREKLAVGGIETLKDPTLLFDTLARSAPGMFAGGVAGRGAGAAANAVGNAAFAKALGTGSEMAARVAVTAKNGAGVLARATATGTAAGIQGASVASETYEELSKLPVEAFKSEPEWSALEKQHGAQQAKEILAGAAANRALLMATGASVLSMKLVPGGDAIEKMFLPPSLKGAAAKAAVASTSLLTRPMGKGMEGGLVSKAVELIAKGSQAGALESVSEGVEEGSGAIAKGLELSRAGQRVNLSEMAGEAYGQGAAAGLVMGKVAGMQEAYGSRAPRVEDQPTTPKAPIVPSAPVAPQAPQSAQTDVATQILRAEQAVAPSGLAAELEVLRARSAPAPDFTQRSTTPQAQPGSVPVTGGLAAELQALRARSSPQEAANAPQRTPSDTQQQTKATSAQAADVAGVNAPVPAANIPGAGVAATQATGVDISTTQGVPANVPQPAQPGTQASQTQSTQGTTTGARVVLQNRDRSTPSSIAQMRSIAARPDYGRLGFSRDFANGAPVVAGGTIQPAQLGRQDVATASDGRRIPVQYAVVDAASVLTSNTVDGSSNPSYGDSNIPAVRAIAGNGRIAGLQSAYQSGNANAYRQELVQDAALHGIDPEVIAPMAQPVLVRVMPAEAVTADIGDISNTVGNLDLSAVEQANNDANRVQLEALQFADDGSITTDAVRQFVRAMPQAEQGQLLDTNGQPTRQAVDRLSAAVFAKAYGNEGLTRLYSQAQDPEARLVMSALAQVAPKMARLEGAGALDIRDVVAQAAEIAVNARRQGVPLARAAQQLDIAADPAVGVVLDLFAANSRSVRPVVEALARAADAAYTEATKPAEDMFGTVPRAGRADIINQLRPENERRSQEALEDAAGRESAAVDAIRQANEPAGSAASATTEAGRPAEDAATEGLTSYTAEEVTQRQAEAAQAEATANRAEDAAARAEAAARQAKEIAQRSVVAADTFELGQSGEDNLSGQGGLKFSRAGDAGKVLNKDQRRAVLETLVDVYKQKNAAREMKGVDRGGNERYGFVYSPDLFEKSDITGAMVRYYVTLPDGRKAHPSELFPSMTASDVESMALKQEEKRQKENAFEAAIKPFYPDFDSANLAAGGGQVVVAKGDRFAVIPERTGAISQARGHGWEIARRGGGLMFSRGTTAGMPENKAPGPQGDAQQGASTGNAVTSKWFTEDNRLSNLSQTGASWQRIRENNPVLRGKSVDDTITVYRATIGDSIRPDDYVAVDKSTLRTELKNVRERDGEAAKIVSMQVQVRDLLMGNDATEFVFFPEQKTEALGTDENTGLPLNADGTVTIYHHTSAAAATAIRRTGTLKAQAEPDVYVTTHRETDTGYGDTAVAIRIDPARLQIDDEFPNGRKDFRLNVGRPGGSIRVELENEQSAPASQGAINRSFAGARAATADQHALVTAQDRLSAGEDAETVRQETGWFQGKDGKWRYEISDKSAFTKGTGSFGEVIMRWYQAGVERTGDPLYKTTVGDVLYHPALFAAYPALAQMEVQMMPKGVRARGRVQRAEINGAEYESVIQIREALPSSEWLSVMLHELQHGIQSIEGFASGGPSGERMWLGDMRPIAMAEYQKLIAEINRPMSLEEYARQAWGVDSVTDEIRQDYAQNFVPSHMAALERKGLDGDLQRTAGWRAYRRLAGEVEARNTQARQGMTDAQRRATPPSQTADVADSEVIVVFNGEEMESAPEPANATGAKAITPIRDYGANYEALAGKDVTYTVPTTEGGTASMTVDAQSVLTQYDQRMQALETLRKCL